MYYIALVRSSYLINLTGVGRVLCHANDAGGGARDFLRSLHRVGALIDIGRVCLSICIKVRNIP